MMKLSNYFGGFKMIKKLISVFLILLSVSAMIYSGGQQSAAEPEGPVVLSLFSYKAAPHEEEALVDILNGFMEENPNIKVEYEVISHQSGYDDVLRTRFAGGTMSDIVMSTPGAFGDLWDSGYLEPLTGSDFLSEYPSTTLENVTREGNTYAIITEIAASGMWYNSKVLEDLNLDYPKDFSQFLDVCESLKNAGYTPFFSGEGGGAGAKFFTVPWAYKNIASSEGFTEYADKLHSEEAQFGEVMREPFEAYLTMISKGYRLDPLNTVNAQIGGEGITALAEGNAIFMPGGSWYAGKFDAATGNENHDIKLGPFMFDDKNYIGVVANGFVSVYSGSEKKEAAKKFLDYWSRKEVMDDYAAKLSSFSPVKGGAIPTHPRLQTIEKPYNAGNITVWQYPVTLDIGNPWSFLNPIVQNLVLESADPAAAVENAIMAINMEAKKNLDLK